MHPPGCPAGGLPGPSGALREPSLWHVAFPLAHTNAYKTPAESTNPAFGSTWAPASTHNMTNKHGIHAKRGNPIKTNEKPTFYTLQAAPPGACQTPSGPLWDLLWTLHPPSRQTGGLPRPTGALTWPSGALLGPPLRASKRPQHDQQTRRTCKP